MWGDAVAGEAVLEYKDYVEIIGFAGAALMVMTLAMRTMISLRVTGIVSSIVQIVFASLAGIWPMLIQHGILLPMNMYRLFEQIRLISRLKVASSGDLSMSWLMPYMHRRNVEAGHILFNKGDAADEMYIVVEGKLRLHEIGADVLPGAVVGELGLLAPNQQRTQTLECVEDAEVMEISYERIKRLYFENPTFGFYFLRLTSARLFQKIGKLEDTLHLREQEIMRLKLLLDEKAEAATAAE